MFSFFFLPFVIPDLCFTSDSSSSSFLLCWTLHKRSNRRGGKSLLRVSNCSEGTLFPHLSYVRVWRCACLRRCVFVCVDVQPHCPGDQCSKEELFYRSRAVKRKIWSILPPNRRVCLTAESFQRSDVGSIENHIWISFLPISPF